TTPSKAGQRRSTIFPLPSSPHCIPTMTALAMSAPLLVGYPGPLRSEWTAGHSTRGWEGGQEGASIRGVNFGTTNLADFPRRRQHPAAARLPAGGDRLRLPLL